MLLSLGVSEVRPLVGVQGEAESTFEGSEMGSEDVRVLREREERRKGRKESSKVSFDVGLSLVFLRRIQLKVQPLEWRSHLCEIDGLESELPESLPTIHVGFRRSCRSSSTELGSNSILIV